MSADIIDFAQKRQERIERELARPRYPGGIDDLDLYAFAASGGPPTNGLEIMRHYSEAEINIILSGRMYEQLLPNPWGDLQP